MKNKMTTWETSMSREMEELEMREIAESLFRLLGDIDSSSDVFKPSDNNPGSYKRFYEYVIRKHGDRFKYFATDGYDLFTKSEWRDKKINKIIGG